MTLASIKNATMNEIDVYIEFENIIFFSFKLKKDKILPKVLK